jgi:hypothetical protein
MQGIRDQVAGEDSAPLEHKSIEANFQDFERLDP